MKPKQDVRGPTYEVVDWQMIHDDQGTYMHVGEPFILRYFSYIDYAVDTRLMEFLAVRSSSTF